MAAVMIGIDPHKASHTAVAINATEEPLGQLRVRACLGQAEQLVAWAHAWPERTWAVEGAEGVGHLLAQQLLSAGERVLDVQPKLAARVRLLATGDINKNDPNDARSVAVAALRSPGVREARRDDHAAVLRVWSKRHRDLGRTRTQVACQAARRAVRADARRGVQADHRRPGRADPGIDHAIGRRAGGPLGTRRRVHRGPARHRHPDPRHQEEAGHRGPRGRDQPDRAVRGRPGDRCRRDRRRPHGVPLPRPGPLRRLQRHRSHRGVLRRPESPPAVAARQPPPGHAIHMAAVTQIRYRHSPGRSYYDKKLAEGKTSKEALRALKRQISDAIFACLQADARRAAAKRPGGQPGNGSASSAAGSHPETPALRTSHSRACYPPYDPHCSLSRAAAIPCERAAWVQDRAQPGRAAATAGRP